MAETESSPQDSFSSKQLPLPPPHHTSKYHLIYTLRKDLNDEDVLDYADFLHSRERMCCPDGYVDSQKLIYQYQLHSPNFSVDRQQAGPEKGAKTPSKASTARGGDGGSGGGGGVGSKSKLIALSMNRERFEREYRAKLKKTEERIGQSKQTERVAKRREGDILKDQREIRVARREFMRDNDRQQQTENQQLNKSMERYTEIKREHHHKMTTLVQQRMHEALQQREEDLNSGRKVMNRSLSLSRQYRTKLDSLQLKRLEVDRLMADYEKRLRLKREQEEALLRELRDLGDDLGIEAMKAKEMSQQQLQQRQLGQKEKVRQDFDEEMRVEEQLTHGSEDQKDSVMRQRRLSAELANRNEHLDAKKRQDDRALIDTRTALKTETRRQRQLDGELQLADTDRRRAGAEQRVDEARQRRRLLAREQMSERRQRADESEEAYAERAQQRAAAAQRADYDEALKHFQRIVSKLEDEEASLYQRVRSTEASRQDEEQQVRRLITQLRRARGQGATESLERLAASNREARQLEEELLRHQSRLDSLTAEREEAYLRLEGKRQELARDRDTLEREKQERDRLVSIVDN